MLRVSNNFRRSPVVQFIFHLLFVNFNGFSNKSQTTPCKTILFTVFSPHKVFVCLFVTEATQFCVTAGSTLIFKSVQSRELGQSPICCIGGARHHAPRAKPDPRCRIVIIKFSIAKQF